MAYTDNEKLRVVYGDFTLGVHGAGFDYIFSYAQGGLESIVKDGYEWLYRCPKPTFWRALTDNDRGSKFHIKSGSWLAADMFIDFLDVKVIMDGAVQNCKAPDNNSYGGDVSANEITVEYLYENRQQMVSAEWKTPVHMPPHLHEAIEIVYVTEGCIELGVGQELYHMEKGDFAIVFPNVIHHYQVFNQGKNRVIYLYLDPSILPSYYKEVQMYSPKYPVIKSQHVHPDVVNAIRFLMNKNGQSQLLMKAYVHMILAHVFTEMPMIDKNAIGSDDLIYSSVAYVAKNYGSQITLEKMANDLGVSKYVLSRMFAKTFHCNFSKYVNGVRLNNAVTELENSQDSITNICLNCGFESQRTFNRVFKDRYKLTPREYRKKWSA